MFFVSFNNNNLLFTLLALTLPHIEIYKTNKLSNHFYKYVIWHMGSYLFRKTTPKAVSSEIPRWRQVWRYGFDVCENQSERRKTRNCWKRKKERLYSIWKEGKHQVWNVFMLCKSIFVSKTLHIHLKRYFYYDVCHFRERFLLLKPHDHGNVL